MDDNSETVQLNRRRKLDELFAEQQYLSTTMRARSLHDRLDDEPRPMMIPIITPEVSDNSAPVNVRDIQWTPQQSERNREDTRSDSVSTRADAESEPKHSHRISITSSDKDIKQDDLMLLQLNITSGLKEAIRVSSQQNTPTPEVMTLEEAANFLRVSLGMMRTWVRENSIPCIHLGKRVRFRKEALLSWLKEQEVEYRRNE